jgi:putative ABC transport system ATP-binding protein
MDRSTLLLDGISLADNLVLPGVLGGMLRRAAEARAHELLELMGLDERSRLPPAMLSGGRRQRLAMARALVNEPAVLLADEPTSALDSAGAAEVLDLFRRLHGAGQTIVMVTHSAAVAAGAARIVRMHDGRVDEPGDKQGDEPECGLPSPGCDLTRGGAGAR